MTTEHTALVIGLTGGIGSGKTVIANTFEKKGVRVVDTDLIAHQLTAPGGAAIEQVRQAFGSQTIADNGAMDRPMMRHRIYSDAAAKRTLENILHPLIRAEVLQQIQKPSATPTPYIMLVVPLLLETLAYRHQVDRILVADCSRAMQIDRVMQRSNMGAQEVTKIIHTQICRAVRLQMADDIIMNGYDLAYMHIQVERQHQKYLALAVGGGAPSIRSP